MVGRVILFCFLLAATRAYGQENSLRQPVSEFDSKAVCLTETLFKFAYRQHLKIAIE